MTPGIILELPLSCLSAASVCTLQNISAVMWVCMCMVVCPLCQRPVTHTDLTCQGPLLLALWTHCWLWSYLSYIPHIWLLFISLSPRNCPCIIHLMVLSWHPLNTWLSLWLTPLWISLTPGNLTSSVWGWCCQYLLFSKHCFCHTVIKISLLLQNN